MEAEKLENFIQEAPKEPGVYLFREGETGRVLYVGKAVDIRERLVPTATHVPHAYGRWSSEPTP